MYVSNVGYPSDGYVSGGGGTEPDRIYFPTIAGSGRRVAFDEIEVVVGGDPYGFVMRVWDQVLTSFETETFTVDTTGDTFSPTAEDVEYLELKSNDGAGQYYVVRFRIRLETAAGSGIFVPALSNEVDFQAGTAGPSFVVEGACFWTDLERTAEDCAGAGVIAVHSNNYLCDLDSNGIDPIPNGFVTGDDFTIILDGDLGVTYFTDWDAGLQRYTVSYPGGLIQGDEYPGTMFQGANSWPCTFIHALS